jgi:hypothetical protein
MIHSFNFIAPPKGNGCAKYRRRTDEVAGDRSTSSICNNYRFKRATFAEIATSLNQIVSGKAPLPPNPDSQCAKKFGKSESDSPSFMPEVENSSTSNF